MKVYQVKVLLVDGTNVEVDIPGESERQVQQLLSDSFGAKLLDSRIFDVKEIKKENENEEE